MVSAAAADCTLSLTLSVGVWYAQAVSLQPMLRR